jgi:outer membrane protein TolC
MFSKRSRALLCGGLAPLALTATAATALAQTPPPAARPAAPAPVAPAPTPAPAPVTPGTPDLPKSRMQTELEARLHAMRSGKGLTADEVARKSIRNSPAIEAKQHAIEGVEGQLGETKYAFWPKVRLSASYTRLSPVHPDLGVDPALLGPFGSAFTDIPENSIAFDGQLSVPLSDYLLRLSHAIAGSSRARESAVFDRSATYAAVDRDARVGYYNWVRAQAQELIAAQSLEQANGHKKDAENAFQAGLLSKADVLGTHAAAKNAELFVERTRNQTELARLALEVSMGDPPGQRYEVGEDIFAPSSEFQSLPTSTVALREATQKRMELKSLMTSEQAFREQAALERVGDYPRLDGQAGISYANPHPRYFPQKDEFNLGWQAGVTLSWIPTDIGGSEAKRDVATAKAAELASQRRSLLNGLRLEIEQALKATEEARFTIDVSSHALTAAEESYRVRRELFRAGRATLVEVTDAETELTNTRLHLADAYVQARIALTQLRHALGRDAEPVRAASR